MTAVQGITLTQGKVALVDADNFEWLSQWKWYARKARHGSFYAVRQTSRDNLTGKQTTLQMHRVILGLTDPKVQVDHEDRNGLNNAVGNLRVATHAQNIQNQGPRHHNTSGYKGVHWAKSKGRWVAQICFAGKQTHLGYFDTAEEAAAAYDKDAIIYHGEFAYQNLGER